MLYKSRQVPIVENLFGHPPQPLPPPTQLVLQSQGLMGAVGQVFVDARIQKGVVCAGSDAYLQVSVNNQSRRAVGFFDF